MARGQSISPLVRDTAHVWRLVGDLDLCTQGLISQIADAPPCGMNVVLDFGDVTFMDCCGYGAVVALANALALQGRALSRINETGEPARLLGLLGIPIQPPFVPGASVAVPRIGIAQTPTAPAAGSTTLMLRASPAPVPGLLGDRGDRNDPAR